jgi:hypothetical protein
MVLVIFGNSFFNLFLGVEYDMIHSFGIMIFPFFVLCCLDIMIFSLFSSYVVSVQSVVRVVLDMFLWFFLFSSYVVSVFNWNLDYRWIGCLLIGLSDCLVYTPFVQRGMLPTPSFEKLFKTNVRSGVNSKNSWLVSWSQFLLNKCFNDGPIIKRV